MSLQKETVRAGQRVKNCFLPCFLHSPSSPREVLSPELKFRRNLWGQDIIHCKLLSLPSERSTSARYTSTPKATRCWHNLHQITLWLCLKRCLPASSSTFSPSRSHWHQRSHNHAATYKLRGRSIPDVLQHKNNNFTIKGEAGICSWEQGPPPLAAVYALGWA